MIPTAAAGTNGGTIDGVVATIKWHEYTAAAVNGYRVMAPAPRQGRPQWTLTATIVLADAFKMSQRPLEFVAKTKRGKWRWPIDTYVRGGSDASRLEARLGWPHPVRT